MHRMLISTALAFAASAAVAADVQNPSSPHGLSQLFEQRRVVNCDHGASLNRRLATLRKNTPATVRVIGTCTEHVQIRGFESLTLLGAPGATLVHPGTPGVVVDIQSSRSVTLDGFQVQAPITNAHGITIGGGSTDIRLRNLTIEGGGEAIIFYEASQGSVARVTAVDPGYTPLGVYDKSDVHVEDCLFEHSTGASWHAGIDVSTGHVTVHGTTIRNMQVGMNVTNGGSVDVVEFSTGAPGPADVVIENPAGTNFYGVLVTFGSLFVVGNANLHITNAGQSWGGDTGGVSIAEGSTVQVTPNRLEIAGSQGQGIFVTNNSHVTLSGARITGGIHGGLVVVNQSTVAVKADAPTEMSGNVTDLFCDSRSLVTGGANVTNATAIQCSNLLADQNEPIP